MNIPDEAVKAAADAIGEYDDYPELYARLALEAAAPHLMAHVEGCESGRYGDTCPCHCHEMKRSKLMTPEQAEKLRDLFYEARQTARNVARDRRDAVAADDAAVEAFNAALREAMRSERDALQTLGAVLHSAGGRVIVPGNAAVHDYEVSKADDLKNGGYTFTARRL